VSLASSAPVNVRVLKYDGDSLRLLLNGQGNAMLEMFVGSSYFDKRETGITDGGINPADIDYGALYRVTIGGADKTFKEIDGLLSVPLNLDGQVEVVIKRSNKEKQR